jgi:hypothetical protein
MSNKSNDTVCSGHNSSGERSATQLTNLTPLNSGLQPNLWLWALTLLFHNEPYVEFIFDTKDDIISSCVR